jgi:hypothetical protein
MPSMVSLKCTAPVFLHFPCRFDRQEGRQDSVDEYGHAGGFPKLRIVFVVAHN